MGSDYFCIISSMLHYCAIEKCQVYAHYDNTPMQYTAILKAVKMIIF